MCSFVHADFSYYSLTHTILQIELDGSFEAGLVTCMEKMVEDVVLQDKINDELVAYRKEQGTFGREIAKRQRRNKSFDPGAYSHFYQFSNLILQWFINYGFILLNEAQWWSSHGSDSPNLRVLAMRILSLTCSSSACERNFSVFQQVRKKYNLSCSQLLILVPLKNICLCYASKLDLFSTS